MNLTSRISHFEFENPIMNASGVICSTNEELDNLAKSKSGSFVSKSCTPNPREGNPLPRYADIPHGSINSNGLSNKGFAYYLDYFLDYQKRNPSKTAFFSIAGMTLEENIGMLKKIQESDFNGITELNLSCPNVPGKPQTGYDFDRTKEILGKTFEFFQKPIGVKMPPYFDIAHFDAMAEILNGFPIQYVNCINSVGNGLFLDVEEETVSIKPKDGFGGIGGAYVKPTALANVRAFYTRLRPDIAVIGTGGVENGLDAFEHILCGANMVQVGTKLYQDGTDAFDRILSELKTIMARKGYKSLEDFRGKLKSK